jgi:hypothetical protein
METRAAIAAPGAPDLRPRSTYDEVPTPTDVGNALAQKSTAPEAPQIATPAKLRSPMLGEGDIEQTDIDMLKYDTTAFYGDKKSKIEDALGSVGRQAMTQPKFEAPIPPQYQQLQTALDELRESQPYRGGDSGMTLKEKLQDPTGTIQKSWQNLTNAITEVSTTDYTPPTQPTPTTVSKGSDNDDPPSFASVGDNATAAQQASQNVTTTVEKDESGNVTGVTTTGGTEEEQQTMQDYVTSAAAGAKGGLFTRRKKKKK